MSRRSPLSQVKERQKEQKNGEVNLNVNEGDVELQEDDLANYDHCSDDNGEESQLASSCLSHGDGSSALLKGPLSTAMAEGLTALIKDR